MLLQQLKDHRANAKATGNGNIEQIEANMAEKYKQMKQNLGLEEALADSSEGEEDAYIRDKKKQRAIALRNARRGKTARPR